MIMVKNSPDIVSGLFFYMAIIGKLFRKKHHKKNLRKGGFFLWCPGED